MFRIGNSSMTPVYLFLLILITNEFLFVHSSIDDQDQNRLENLRQNAMERWYAAYLKIQEDSSSDDNDLQLPLKPTVQRRFCCMSPLSGRKRSIRDLARKQQLSKVFIESNF